MKNIYLFFVVLIFCFSQTILAQNNSRVINDITTSKRPNELLISNLDKVNEDAVFIVQKIKLNHFAKPTVTLNNIQSSKVSNSEVKDKTKIPAAFEPSVHLSMEKKQAIAYVLIPQYKINQDGTIEKLTNYSLDVKEDNSTANKTTGARVYANKSVLSTGKWYKISIANQGIVKLDYDFIKFKLGVDPSTFNSSNIRVYGNGGVMLAEDNSIFRNDDLVENVIQVVDGNDGKIDQDDYILFYANGPDEIIKDSINQSFTHRKNLYNDVSYYFINFDLGAGKRIVSAINPTTSNQIVTSFNDYQFHEKDSANFGRFGKTWWGDEFNDLPGRYLNRTFSFTFPNLDVNSPISVTAQTGTISHSGASNMAISVNGNSFTNFFYSSFGYEFFDPVIRVIGQTKDITVNSSTINIAMNFTKGGSDAAGFIDYLSINARRNLVFNGYLNFADWNSVGSGNIANYQIQNANANTRVWDITNPLEPILMNTTLNGTTLSFNQNAEILHRFVALDGSSVLTPTFIEKTNNQNLHNLTSVDYIIVSHPSLITQANELANYHSQKRGYKTLVVTPQEIYNEFSSGSQDVCAIRDFAKMLYDKAPTITDIPSYLLLFGDASYDYKNRINNNTNLVPTFETPESVSKTSGYCTDDFFGFLDDGENINKYDGTIINTLDIGIGRFPVSTIALAKNIINKIKVYDSPESFGPWKNNMTFNADNADYNSLTHMGDAEYMANTVNDSLPVYNSNKIYVDGYVLQSTPAGFRCPDANTAVREQLYNGTFLMNYNGHGNPHSWCGERIFSQDDINVLTNLKKLPLFITATCDFAPFDNPNDFSAGEILLSKADGGAIALMTTTQLVYADQNRIMNQNYMLEGFSKMSNGKMPTLGDAYRLSKNLQYVSSVSEYVASNFRKFALLGDPALPLAFPKYDIFTDSVNGVSIDVKYDTLKALNKYTISGHVSDKQGNFLPNFNGIIYPTVFDKPKKLSTLQQNGDPKVDYLVQNNAIYKGKASVKNGKFSFTFVVPKDINYEIAKGKISYYANTETEDANGYDNQIYIGGSSSNGISDNKGPIIKPFMNDEKFVDGGIVTANSTLIVKLSDDNGINYTGNSIGHDITAILDNNAQNTFVLNKFYEADLDDYRSGVVHFPVNNLSEGTHSLTIKAWDIFNNSSEAKITFEVVSTKEGNISHVYNYPNPFSTKTKFMFEHNMPNQDLYITIQVLTFSGKVVKSIKTTVNTPGTRVDNIEWDGLDQYGDKIGNGVYLYKLFVKSASGFSDSKLEKLIILN